jgi:hypothetical protein
MLWRTRRQIKSSAAIRSWACRMEMSGLGKKEDISRVPEHIAKVLIPDD